MALLITWDNVISIAKAIETELAALPAIEQDGYMNASMIHAAVQTATMCKAFIEYFGQDAHDSYIKQMQAYWAAHLANQTLVEPGGDGASTGESIGSVSAGRNQPVNNPQADQGHLETAYGRQFQYYLDQYINAIEQVKQRSIIALGVCNNGAVSGFPKILPTLC